MRITVSLLGMMLLLLSTVSYSQDIQDLYQPSVWLKVEEEGLEATRWKDYSGNGYDATIPDGSKELKYINENPARSFRPSDARTLIPFNIEGLPDLTFIVVYQTTDTLERGWLGTKASTYRDVQITTNRVLGPDSLVDSYPNTGTTAVLSTVIQSWENRPEIADPSQIILGSVDDEEIKHFSGSIAELLIFDKILSFLDRAKWESYLAVKYGMTLQDKNYVSTANEVLWTTERNQSFGRRIAAIGRDDLMGLEQRYGQSSQDTEDFFHISLAETTTLPDYHFLVWGDNGGTTEAVRGSGTEATITMVDRKWQMQVTGQNIRETGSDLYFNTEALPESELGYWLVIDRSGSGDFGADNVEYIESAGITEEGYLQFRDIRWDTDGSGKDHFALMQRMSLLAVARTVNAPLCADDEDGQMRVEVISGMAPFSFEWNKKGSDESIESTGQTMTINNLRTGLYELKVKDSEGQELTRLVELNMGDELSLDLGPDQDIQSAVEVTFDASESIPAGEVVSYSWESSKSGYLSDEARITVTEPGVYAVEVTKESTGCVFTDEVAVTGALLEEISLFPNPIIKGEEVTIGISLTEVADIAIQVTNVDGRTIQVREGNGQQEYRFKFIPPTAGQYIIKIQTPQGTQSKAISVQ